MKHRAKPRTKGATASRAGAIAHDAPLFCRNCGEPASELDSFCPACGTAAEEE